MTIAREVAQLTETLKQKVQAKAQRIRSYEKRETQYNQKNILKEDTKKFYRHLGMKNRGCPRRNVKYFGRVFLMLNYTDITQNTYIQS